jgi:prophage antirepressor-like protein
MTKVKIQSKLVNNKNVRYTFIDGHNWVFAVDFAATLGINCDTLKKYFRASSESEQYETIFHIKFKAIILKIDKLLEVTRKIANSKRFKKKQLENRTFAAQVSRAIAFLEVLAIEFQLPDDKPSESHPSSNELEQTLNKLAKLEAVTPVNFEFMGHSIRFVGTEEIPEWVAADAISVLYPEAERESNNKYLQKIEGRWLHKKKILMKVGNKDAVRTLGTIYEPGLYQLIATSGSSLASEFKRWVFEEVLPSIRKTGSYTTSGIDASCLKSQLLPNSTITDIDGFAQFAAGKIAETNLPQSIKNLYLIRALREAFPQNKEFDILTQALSNQDLQAHQDKITFRTYHSTAGLAEVYGSKHKLSEPIDRRIIHRALIEKNLLRKGERKSEYLPTELGKHYCIVGWHHNEDESLIPEVQWRQEVLNVLGSLH